MLAWQDGMLTQLHSFTASSVSSISTQHCIVKYGHILWDFGVEVGFFNTKLHLN